MSDTASRLPRTQLRLCLNCLSDDADAFAVGPEQGTQRDPYRTKIDLCPACSQALLTGDLVAFAARNSRERTIEL